MSSMFDDEMIRQYSTEAMEHILECEEELLRLEEGEGDQESLNRIFRGIHTVKGGAGFLELDTISGLSHEMEELLSLARSGRLALEVIHYTVLIEGIDVLKSLIENIFEKDHPDSDDLISRIKHLHDQALHGKTQEPSVVEKVESLISQSELKNLEEIEKGEDENFVLIRVVSKTDLASNQFSAGKYFTGLETRGRVIRSRPDRNVLESLGEEELPSEFQFIYLTDMDDALLEIMLEVPDSQWEIIEPDQLPDLYSPKASEEVETPSEPKQPDEELVAENQTTEHKFEPEDVQSASLTAPAQQEFTPNAGPLDQKKLEKTLESGLKSIRSSLNPESTRVSALAIANLVEYAGELITSRNQLSKSLESSRAKDPRLAAAVKHFSSMTDELQEIIISMRMLPLSAVLGKFPKVTSDLAESLGKEIDLQLHGADIDLDKTIIESLSDPLTHLVRNSVDHGIESPQERKAKGKNSVGSLLISASNEGGEVVLEMIDDGKGINPQVIASKALEKGIVDQHQLEQLNDQQKVNLIFVAGFSTRDQASDVSGRGVGMDVVKTNIEGSGGSIEIYSEVDKGSRIKIRLPLTLAIESALIVRAGQFQVVLPQLKIIEMISLDENSLDSVTMVQGQCVINLRGDLINLVDLMQILQVQDSEGDGGVSLQSIKHRMQNKRLHIAILQSSNLRAGLVFDSILASEEIVVKPIPQFLASLGVFGGVSITGDGSVMPVLDVSWVLEQYIGVTHAEFEVERSIEQSMLEKGMQIESLIAKKGDYQFSIPVDAIHKLLHISKAEVIQKEGESLYEYNQHLIQIYLPGDRLSGELQVGLLPEDLNLILIESGQQMIGLVATEIVHSTKLKIIPPHPGWEHRDVSGYSLKDGEVIYQLHPESLTRTLDL